MDKQTQNLAWACLPKEAREQLIHLFSVMPHDYSHTAFKGLVNIFGHHNLNSDTEPTEFICVERVKVDALQSEIFKEIMDAHDAEDWQSVAHYILDVMPRSFHVIFGDKCLPDEECPKNDTESVQNLRHSEQSSVQGEPKFKVGDKVIVKANAIDPSNHIGEIAEINYHFNPDIYKVKITPCGYYIIQVDDLEPYTEPSNVSADETMNETKDNMEEKELNLCELLKGCEGEKFFSLMFGDVTFVKIVDNPNISVGEKPIATSEGRYLPNAMYGLDGVPTLFPSRALYEKYPLDANKAWQIWASERKPKRWRANVGETYWWIDDELIAHECAERDERDNNANYEVGNYFRTEEEAQQAAEAVRETLKKFRKEHTPKPDK